MTVYEMRDNRICPLCETDGAEDFEKSKDELYKCVNCALVFTASHLLPASDAERERYLQHNNSPEDEGYVKFLRKIIEPVSKRLDDGADGLDLGCGPGPAVSIIMGGAGYNVSNYDPLFYPDEELLNKSYDFIICSEAAEHFFYPKREFELMKSLLNDGGVIGLMTQTYDGVVDFDKWHYRRDETHVSFFSVKTFEYLGEFLDMNVEIASGSTAVYY